MSGALYWRLTIRNKADDGDLLVLSSWPGDTNPYLTAPIEGDGTSFNPQTGEIALGEYVARVADADTGAVRVLTNVLADANGRWQCLGYRAIVADSPDGSAWTNRQGCYVLAIEFESAIEASIRLGDSDRRERRAVVFAEAEGEIETARLIGGPLAFGPIAGAPYDHWVFRVVRTGDTDANLPDDAVDLTFERGWMYRNFFGLLEVPMFEAEDEIADEVVAVINPIAAEAAETTADGTVLTGVNVVVETTAGVSVGTFKPYGWASESLALAFTVGKGDVFVATKDRIVLKWEGTLPADDTVYHVTASRAAISENNPGHFTGTIAEYARELFDLRSIPYNTASADQLELDYGHIRVAYRFTRSKPFWEALRDWAFGPFGFSVRMRTDGDWEFFQTRNIPSGSPSTTFTNDDLTTDTSELFLLDEESRVNRVVWRTTEWQTWTDDIGGERPVDGVIGRSVTRVIEPDEDEVTEANAREVTYEVPGEVSVAGQGGIKNGVRDWMIAEGRTLLDRYLRGAMRSTLRVLRSVGFTGQIGDYVVSDLDHRPAPDNDRGGERVGQVLQYTPTPGGVTLVVEDVAANTESELVPTFTLAKSATDPRHVAEATITNSGALAGTLVRVEMATGASEPAGNGATVSVRTPDANAFALPVVPAGSTVWVRMRSEAEGELPGAWSAWASVALDALLAVTSLANAAGANDTERLITWTVGDATLPIRVRWKLTADADYTSSVTLAAGSNQLKLTGLIPGAEYEVEVVHLDVDPYTGESVAVTTTFTLGSTIPTLNPPFNPAGHSDGAGVYGIEVTAYAAEMPSRVEVQIAVEDSPGAGTYGAYATDGSVVSVTPGRTRYSTSAPNDGLKRKLKARHTKSGYTESAYTTEVVVGPWGALDLPEAPITGSFVTVNDESTGLPDSRQLAVADGISKTDAGAGSTLTLGLTDLAVDVGKLDIQGTQFEGAVLGIVGGVPTWTIVSSGTLVGFGTDFGNGFGID